jgi:regulator of protease activity HflC (stomatin/prohibitin superfamily)
MMSFAEENRMSRPEANEPRRDPYQAVVMMLLAAALLGTVGAIAGGIRLSDPVLLAVAVTMGLASGVLTGVFLAQRRRIPSAKAVAAVAAVGSEPALAFEEEMPAHASGDAEGESAGAPAVASALGKLRSQLRRLPEHLPASIVQWFRNCGTLGIVSRSTVSLGAIAIWVAAHRLISNRPGLVAAAIASGLCIIAAGFSATVVHYLGGIDTSQFPESPALRRGARAVAWMFGLAAVSVALVWLDQRAALRVLFVTVLGLDAAFCYGLFRADLPGESATATFPLDIGVLSVIGSRTNILGSILDSAERQMGIDLRSTWALSVIRRSLEPLLLGLCLSAWLSTSLTVVSLEEQGLIECFGVPVGGQPMLAGIHLHWPWPVDRAFRIPVRRVQVLEVGHEGNEAPGPENVLWAVEHAPNEFTLLLGNGRDLITVDAGVQYRIRDAAAWRYHCQNPAEALSAIAYRAVMRNTVNLTLSDALSQNVAGLTGRMRRMIQTDADALGLGVEILGFTVGGMHPPVAVARDYQAVISAEVQKVTAVVNAQVYRARILPAAEASAIEGENQAHAEGAEALGKAAGEAWSFRTLEAEYHAAPALYFFRRRLETLEKGLTGRNFTILDNRIQRDGGELWITP